MNHIEHEISTVDLYQHRSVDFNRSESNPKPVNAQLDQEKLLSKHEHGLSIQMVANTRLERQKYKD